MRRWSFVLVLCALSTQKAWSQEPLDFLGSDRETAAQVTRILESVRAANLPTEKVVAKARLAAQRHVPPSRMIAALEAVASRLQVVRATLGPTASEADINAGEDALSTTGVTKEMLSAIRDAQPNQPIAVPIGVMAQLVASGVAPKRAAEIVGRLVRGRATNVQLVALGNNVSQDVNAGAGAASALDTRLETLKPLLAYGTGVSNSAVSDPVAGLTTTGATSAPKGPQNPRGRP